MAVSGNAAITIIDLLRKPPDSSAAKSSGATGQFQELFQSVSADSTQTKTAADATQAPDASTRTPVASAADSARESSSVARADAERPEASLVRDATVAGREAMPRESQAPTTQTVAAATDTTRSDASQAPATSAVDTSAADTAAQPTGDAPTDTAAVDSGDVPASQQAVAEGSQEATPVVAESAPEVTVVDPTLAAVSVKAPTTPVDVVAPEAGLTEAATQTSGAAVVATEAVEVIVSEEAGAPVSGQSASTPTPTADPSVVRTVGQEFPTGTAVAEKVSTDQLIQALEARIAAQEASPTEVAAWRQAMSMDADEPSVLNQVWARAQSGSQSAFLPLTGMQGAAAASQSATAGAPLIGAAMLAAAGAGGPTQVGTHPASSVMRSMSAQTDGATRSVRQGFALGASVPQASEAGSSLEAAQAALSRRAADRAFQSPRVVAEQAPRVVDMLGEGTARFGGTEQAVRDAIVARQNRMHSFVRAQRVRGSAPSPIVGGAGSGAGAEQATPIIGAVTTSAPGTAAAASSSGTTTHQTYTPLMEFLANEIRRNVRLGKREFRILMNPEELGNVELEMVMDGDALSVRIKAASKPSQRILEENLGDLAKALEAVGMDLESEIPWVAERELAEAAIADANARQSAPTWI
jgi:hypothetical protein